MVTHSPTDARPLQYRLSAVLLVMALIALVVAPLVALQSVMYRSPHQRAIDSVNGLDGWAREESDGHIVADLNRRNLPNS